MTSLSLPPSTPPAAAVPAARDRPSHQARAGAAATHPSTAPSPVLEALRETTRPSAPPAGIASDERGVYPCPFGFVVNVPLQRSDRLVPVMAADAAALAPLADALSLVRASGGFDARRLSVPTAEIRFVFERVPDRARATRRLRVLAGDLLALGHELLPREPGLDFQPAIELRFPEAQALSVHLYVEGTSSAHETLLAHLANRLEPMLRALIDAPSRVEAPFVLRRRVLARCQVDLAQLFSSLPERAHDPARETWAVRRALHWLAAARSEPVLAVAQNELVLSNAARVTRALDDDGRRSTAEGRCHAARFGATVPLASFAAAGTSLIGALELPLAFDGRRPSSVDAALATGLMRGGSMEDVGVLSTCLGLAAQLASVKAAISLALCGVVPLIASAPSAASLARPASERRSSLPPPLAPAAPARPPARVPGASKQPAPASAPPTRATMPALAERPSSRPPARRSTPPLSVPPPEPSARATTLPSWARLPLTDAATRRASMPAPSSAPAPRRRLPLPRPASQPPAVAAATTARASKRSSGRAPRVTALAGDWPSLRASTPSRSSSVATVGVGGERPTMLPPARGSRSSLPASSAKHEDSGIRPAIHVATASPSAHEAPSSRRAPPRGGRR